MKKLSYRNWNNLVGWGMGLSAFLVYLFTMEPTASYWDCGEFIAVSYKLEVPHPPGAPFYLMIGRMFSMLAAGNVEHVAYCVNLLSAMCGGATILFLFWTITLLLQRLLQKQNLNLTPTQQASILIAGVMGSLIGTFSDSFWFSASEAEVYAMSSLFTALIIWAILKWDTLPVGRKKNQWFLFISYLIGLSIGVHLLGLLAIPGLTLLYYYRHYTKTSFKGACIAIAIGIAIVGLITNGIIQGLPGMGAGFDIFFVNTLGLPFYSGILLFLILLLGALGYGLYYAQKNQKALLSTLLISLLLILVGYSSYTLVLIRSTQNPPIDENNPEELLQFLSYLKREQYGDRPLVYGRNYNTRMLRQEKGDPIYRKAKHEYKVISWEFDNEYESTSMTLFPRMYSTRDNHPDRYREIIGLGPRARPTIWNNINFFLNYQVGYMYLRYFLWNFSGREHGIQGASWLAPWESGAGLPKTILENKARNQFWALPLLLGVIGLVFHYRKDAKGFSFVGLLFFMTGVGIVLYLNMPPSEPRERDYIYAGSYYMFAIWTGIGVVGLFHWLSRLLPKVRPVAVLALAGLVALPAPIVMALDGWDDHNRSKRYFSIDSARNLLESCAPNAVLFTGGDNDTFPLWYAQEVEGIRTDVRVVVLSYFNTDWYIKQMARPAYDSPPLRFGVSHALYAQGGPNDYLLVEPIDENKWISARQLHKLIQLNDKRLKYNTEMGEYNIIPSRNLYLDIDQSEIESLQLIPEALKPASVDRLYLKVKSKSFLEKKDLAILDLLLTEGWQRPIYFNHTSLSGVGIDFSDCVVQEGLAFRLLPVSKQQVVRDLSYNVLVNPDTMYRNVTERFRWRGLQDSTIYYTDDYRNFVLSHRNALSMLAHSLLQSGDLARADTIIHLSLDKMPHAVFPYGLQVLPLVEALFELGKSNEALRVTHSIARESEDFLRYYRQLPAGHKNKHSGKEQIAILRQIVFTLEGNGLGEAAAPYQALLERYQ